MRCQLQLLAGCLSALVALSGCGGSSGDGLASTGTTTGTDTGTTTGTGTGTSTGTSTTPPAPAMSIKVSNGHLVDQSGATVQLRGVNVSGLEGAAILGFDPSNPWGNNTGDPTPNWATIKTWGTNAVRLPLNEASWLELSCKDVFGDSVTVNSSGTSVPDSPGQIIKADPGNNYQATVVKSVNDAVAAGFYVILDLHLAAPNQNGTPVCPNRQNAMADSDHSVAFWSSLANTFKNNPAVLFELFNEPNDGPASAGTLLSYILGGGAPEGVLYLAGGTLSLNWTTVGYQQMLNAVRATGATNVVIVGTDAFSQDMIEWLGNVPTDSANQLAAAWHPYPADGFPTQVSCIGLPACSAKELTAVQGIIAAGYPVIATEYGDAITSQPGNSSPWASVLLPWADKNGVSYLGWTWDPWPGMNWLITDAAGDPTNGYGTYVKQHYLCVKAGTANCP